MPKRNSVSLRILMTRFFLRLRTASATRSTRLHLVERIALGTGQSLLLVEADGQTLLITTTSDASSTVFALRNPDPTPGAEEASPEDVHPLLMRRNSTQTQTAARRSAGRAS